MQSFEEFVAECNKQTKIMNAKIGFMRKELKHFGYSNPEHLFLGDTELYNCIDRMADMLITKGYLG